MGPLSPESKYWFRMKNLAVRMGDQLVLENIDWDFQQGEHWGLLGGNGAGKSTLLKILRQERPYCAGTLQRHPALEGTKFLAGIQLEQPRRWISLEEQKDRWEEYSEREQFPSRVADLLPAAEGWTPQEQNWMEMLDGLHLWDRPLRGLSNGEWRKVLLLQALLRHPKLLLLDEPFDGLDHTSAQRFQAELETLLQEGEISLLLVTHRQEELLTGLTHLLALRGGQRFFCGPREEVGTLENFADLYRLPSKSKDAIEGVLSGPALQSRRKTGVDPVVLKNIDLHYGEQLVLQKFSWTWPEGEHWQITGPNGSGKSTLLRLIAADHLQAYNNEVWFFGKRRGSGENIWDLRKQIGTVTPELQLNYRQPITARKVILSGFADSIGYYQAVSRQQQETAQYWIVELGLELIAEQFFPQLSYGQQRLVLLARALVKNPQLLLLDEPCQGLDPAQRNEWLQRVDRLGATGQVQILYVSHVREEALKCLHGILTLPSGEVHRIQPQYC